MFIETICRFFREGSTAINTQHSVIKVIHSTIEFAYRQTGHVINWFAVRKMREKK